MADQRHPPTAYKSQYPFNQATCTEGGHTVEYDNTPGQERVRWSHKSGTYVEVAVDGREVRMVVGDHHVYSQGGHTHTVDKHYDLKVEGVCRIIVGGDAYLEVGGDLSAAVGGDAVALISGDATLGVGGDLAVKVDGDAGMVVDGDVALKVAGDAAAEVDGDLTCHVEGDTTLTLDGDLKAKVGGDAKISVGGDTDMELSGDLKLKVGGDITSSASSWSHTGDITVDGEVTSDGISLPHHVHPDVTSGSDDTGEPE